MKWKHGSKPVIGLIGGIGSGKSWIAALFARHGCAVIDSDRLSHEVLQSPDVQSTIRGWFGDAVVGTAGTIDRRKLAEQVFSDPAKLDRLNHLIHPLVAQRRDALMVQYMADPAISAIVWDSPLLVETGLYRDCDALVMVNAPAELRFQRVVTRRGWTELEMQRREKLQFPLDKKASLADYVIDNSGDEASSLSQVLRVLSHLSAKN